MTSRAGAYLTGSVILVHPIAQTDAGVGIHVPPVSRLRASATAMEVGAALRAAVGARPAVLPHPDRNSWKMLGDQFLRAAQCRSWRQLQTDAKHCWIRAVDGHISITPLANGGTRGPHKGFQPFGASEIRVLEAATDQTIGQALLDALAACQ
jgi:hypothetical protein